MFALAVFSMSSFVACKDYDEDSYDDLKARINTEKNLREQLEQQIKDLWTAIGQIKSCGCKPENYASQTEFQQAQKKLDALQKTLDSLIQNLPSGGGGGDTTIIYIENPYNDSLIFVRLNQHSDSLKMLNTLNSWLVYVENLAKQDSIRIDSLRDAIAGWGDNLTNLNTRVDSIVNALTHTHDTIYIGGCDSVCKAKIAEAKAAADSAMKLSEKALQLAQTNSDRIDDLERAVRGLVTKGQLAEEVYLLNKRIDDLLDKMVTGIIIQGTESPVIGYFNTPLDVRSQMLAAYYGEATNNVSFPSVKTADYVDASEFWTERNVEVMGINPANAEGKVSLNGGEQFVGQKDGKEAGNAGKLYLTVNPSNVDFTNKTLTLENSKGEASVVSLSPLKKSDKELTFGYTRANNGFYETEATLKASDIDKAKVRINFKDLEDEAKAMLKQKTKSSVLGFGAALLSSMKDVMPAYAIKATWTSPENTYDMTTTKSYDVYSQYGLAATAIKPFSFAFLKDLNVKLPGETRIQNMLDELIDKININFNLDLPDFSTVTINFGTIDINTITSTITVNFQYILNDADGNPIYILVTNQAGKLEWMYLGAGDQEAYWYDENGGFHWAEEGLTVSFQKLEINKNIDVNLYNTLKDIIDQVNDQWISAQDQLRDMLNEIQKLNTLNDQINDAILDAKDDLKSQLNGYITKIYNKLNSIFSKTPNRALQPILIAKDGTKISMLSKSKKNPTKVSGTSLELVPTSYTLELLAPAYKKFVAVTDVWDAAGNPAAASIGKAANGDNMLKVIDSEKTCTIKGQAGYTYEIAYSAIDYHGKVVMSLLLFLGVLSASAQAEQKGTTEYVFQPHWYITLQGGGQYTLGEGKFSDLLSPTAQIGVGYNFSKVVGLRLAVNAWQSKGVIKLDDNDIAAGLEYEGKWKWNYVAPSLEFTFNLSNIVCNYNPNRLLNVYALIGGGVNIGFKNDEAQDVEKQIAAYQFR